MIWSSACAVAQVTVVVPAFLNNEVGILDDTLRAHARLAYRGPLTVLLVYNKGPAGPAGEARLEQAENELHAAWAGREEGNVRCVCTQRPCSGRAAAGSVHSMPVSSMLGTFTAFRGRCTN